MKTNVGAADRLFRIVLGLALLSTLFVLHDSARWVGLIGLVPLATGLLRWCPLYSLLGFDTCPVKK